MFLAYSCLGWSGCCNMFGVFFARDEMGLSLDLIGKVGASTSVILILLTYPFGVVLDRWGSHITMIANLLVFLASGLLMFFFANSKTSYIVWSVIRTIPLALAGLALMKWTVEVYPRDRYGQFGSAGALFSSIGGMVLGPLAGWFIDWVKIYRYLLIWQSAFSILGVVSALVVYRRWKTLGGPAHYQAP